MKDGAALRFAGRGLGKSFGATRALSTASLEIAQGEVHALLGENGAGKSTLVQIVSGALSADDGTMSLDGAPYSPASPSEARRAGVAIVYQEPHVCPHLSVAENVLLGVEPARFGLIASAELREQAARALALVRPPGDAATLALDSLAGELAPAERQLLCIARALAAADCRLLILDEPTASLAAEDVERLFDVVRRLRERGISILYISHFLEEVSRIADRFTVLRDGATVGSGKISDTGIDDLVTLMAGRPIDRAFTRTARAAGEVVLTVRGLAGAGLPVDATLELCRGEVLGLAGLIGSGRTELLRAIFGLDVVRRGEVRVGAVGGPASPLRRLAQGVGLLSEDRKGEGLAAELTLAQNLTLSKLAGLGPLGLVLPARERSVTTRWIERLGIRARGPDQRVGELSGGNQQKLALARLLHHDVDVLLLDEPTRGIDVASRLEIYALVDQLAAQGKAVLLVSSQLPELLALSDRVAVMHRGVLGAARPVTEVEQHALTREVAAG